MVFTNRPGFIQDILLGGGGGGGNTSTIFQTKHVCYSFKRAVAIVSSKLLLNRRNTWLKRTSYLRHLHTHYYSGVAKRNWSAPMDMLNYFKFIDILLTSGNSYCQTFLQPNEAYKKSSSF